MRMGDEDRPHGCLSPYHGLSRHQQVLSVFGEIGGLPVHFIPATCMVGLFTVPMRILQKHSSSGPKVARIVHQRMLTWMFGSSRQIPQNQPMDRHQSLWIPYLNWDEQWRGIRPHYLTERRNSGTNVRPSERMDLLFTFISELFETLSQYVPTPRSASSGRNSVTGQNVTYYVPLIFRELFYLCYLQY